MIDENVIAEISNTFSKQEYSSKKDLIWTTGKQIDRFLEDCGFVYVSENGNVIHVQKYCGTSLGYPVHIEQAVKHGYTKLCKKCATGTWVEYFLNKILEKGKP